MALAATKRVASVSTPVSLGQLMKHFGVGNATLTDWLRGIEPPE
jgi:hypothetical protein